MTVTASCSDVFRSATTKRNKLASLRPLRYILRPIFTFIRMAKVIRNEQRYALVAYQPIIFVEVDNKELDRDIQMPYDKRPKTGVRCEFSLSGSMVWGVLADGQHRDI